MKTSFNSPYLKAFALCAGFFSFVSCNEYELTPNTFIPEVDNIHTFQMTEADFDLSLSHGKLDSILTSNYAVSSSIGKSSAVMLGSINNDPYFGNIWAGFYFQVRPTRANFAFPENARFDSAVLVIPHSNSSIAGINYGDTSSSLNINVFNVTEDFSDDTKHYNTSSLAHDATPIASKVIRVSDYQDTVKQVLASGDTVTSELRIKFNQDFAQQMFNLDTANLASLSKFKEFTKGFYIAPDTTRTNSLLSYFLMPTTSSTNEATMTVPRIEFHYKHNDTNKVTTFPFDNAGCGYFTHFSRNRSGFPVENALTTSVDKVILEGTPGIYTDITIKGIQSIPQSVINKAQLVFTVEKVGLDNFYLPISSILPSVLQPNNKVTDLAEMLYNDGSSNSAGASFVDGYSKTVEIDGNSYVQYSVNIPRTIQQAQIEGKDSITLRIKGSSVFMGAYRTVMYGINDNSQFKTKFNIIYTIK